MNKKMKGIFFAFALAILSYAPNAMAATCYSRNGDLIINSSGREITIGGQIPNTVSLVITIIKVAVPIVLVILGMLDLFKGITASKEDEIKKGQQLFVKRLISAVLVFFVVTIVQLVISFADNDQNSGVMDCANCVINGMDKCEKRASALEQGTKKVATSIFKSIDKVFENLNEKIQNTTATISFDSNGQNVTLTTNEISVTYQSVVTAPKVSKNPVGYTFVKWCTNSDGSGNCYVPGETIKYTNSIPLDIKLYAIWEAKK